MSLHDDDMVLSHVERIATAEKAIEGIDIRLGKIEKKIDSNLYILLAAIAVGLLNIAATQFHLFGV